MNIWCMCKYLDNRWSIIKNHMYRSGVELTMAIKINLPKIFGILTQLSFICKKDLQQKYPLAEAYSIPPPI